MKKSDRRKKIIESDSDSDSTYDPDTDSKNVTDDTEYTEESMDDDDELDSTDSDEEDEDDEDEDSDKSSSSNMSKYNKREFQKMLSKMFPSKYMSKKVAKDKKHKSSSRKSKVTKKSKSKSKSKSSRRRVISSDSESDAFSEEYETSEDEDDDMDSESLSESSDDEKELLGKSGEMKNYGIVMTIDTLDDENSASAELEFDANEECGSEDEKTFMKEKYEKLDLPVTVETPSSKNSKKSKDLKSPKSKKSDSKKSKKTDSKTSKTSEKEVEVEKDAEKEYLELLELKKHFIEQLKKHPKNKILLKSIQQCKNDINKLVKESRNKNAKEYHKLVHSDLTHTNEMEYFRKKLSNQEQKHIMSDLKEINKNMFIDKPYRLALLQSKIPAKFKAVVMQRLNMLNTMEPGDNEYYKIRNWVDTFMRIPFGIYRSISVSMTDGIDVCHDFMYKAKNTLDTCVYGLNDAKMQIMQMIGQWIVNPNAMGTAIAIHGPPGTGKTSIVKDGISKILGREFAFIALGGSGDSSFLEGHSYTYEGSTWGKIVQILIDSKCMNPVIYFDELDKVSDSPRGQEIIGVLTHLTDTTQNSQFHDKYFSEIDFDLSKCLFIFSYNDEHCVNPILKDRMYRIQTSGYDAKEKIKIARDYLLPKIREQVKFSQDDVIIPDDILNYLITNSKFTKNESGVRNLKRCLEIIYTKLNLFRLTKSETKMFDKEMDIKIEFPITVTKKEVDLFIKGDAINPSILAMYV